VGRWEGWWGRGTINWMEPVHSHVYHTHVPRFGGVASSTLLRSGASGLRPSTAMSVAPKFASEGVSDDVEGGIAVGETPRGAFGFAGREIDGGGRNWFAAGATPRCFPSRAHMPSPHAKPMA